LTIAIILSRKELTATTSYRKAETVTDSTGDVQYAVLKLLKE